MKHKILFTQRATEVPPADQPRSALPDGLDFEGAVLEGDDVVGRFYGDPGQANRYPEQLTMVLVAWTETEPPDLTADELYTIANSGEARSIVFAPRPRFFASRINDVHPGKYDIHVIGTRL